MSRKRNLILVAALAAAGAVALTWLMSTGLQAPGGETGADGEATVDSGIRSRDHGGGSSGEKLASLRATLEGLESEYRKLRGKYKARYELLMREARNSGPGEAVEKAESEYRAVLASDPRLRSAVRKVSELAKRNAGLHQELNAALEAVQEQASKRRAYWEKRRKQILEERERKTQELLGKDPNDLPEARKTEMRAMLKEYEGRLRALSRERSAEKEDPPQELKRARADYRKIAGKIVSLKKNLKEARRAVKELRQQLPREDGKIHEAYQRYNASRAAVRNKVKRDPKLRSLEREMEEVQSRIREARSQIAAAERNGASEERGGSLNPVKTAAGSTFKDI
jgi:chromosome segregation ATPase